MERKVSGRRKGPLSPRNERREEEEVFEYPGLEDESDGSGPVSRDAYTALRQGTLIREHVVGIEDSSVCIGLSES